MNFIGNLIWIICGGLFSAIGWWLAGILWCITIIGIPFGMQFFKIARLSLFPFGARIVKITC
ncbi:YccF domain-containing protein [Butyrivibrio sp. TB]|uniref:YccF domain-containing protein n=1 Tax=Butyrivibrio sp. TB TaxID=1520809 RepID=UPI0008C22505|nr:Inner membrane component domain-containing protein [Butyrivibrio sp. TB]